MLWGLLEGQEEEEEAGGEPAAAEAAVEAATAETEDGVEMDNPLADGAEPAAAVIVRNTVINRILPAAGEAAAAARVRPAPREDPEVPEAVPAAARQGQAAPTVHQPIWPLFCPAEPAAAEAEAQEGPVPEEEEEEAAELIGAQLVVNGDQPVPVPEGQVGQGVLVD